MTYNSAHVWYYAPEMREDEALLIKCSDTKGDGCAEYTPHAAYTDPTTPPDAPPREGIEVPRPGGPAELPPVGLRRARLFAQRRADGHEPQDGVAVGRRILRGDRKGARKREGEGDEQPAAL